MAQLLNIVILIFKKCTYYLFSLLLLFFLFSSKIIVSMLGVLIEMLESICLKWGLVYFISTPENEAELSFEPRFTDNEIMVMAKKTPLNIDTIEKIKNHFNVSYRQAKKIKDKISDLQNSPDIHSIYA